MSSKIAAANKLYYSSKGKKIYSDFSTFAQGKALAQCNAIEFCRDFSAHKEPVITCEYGVGKGDFARTFLDEVKKRNRRLYAKTRYYLFDFSDKMLDAARANLKSHRAICIFGKFDASHEQPDLHFDYCRINELLTDLPAQFFMKKGQQISELLPDKGEEFTLKPVPTPSPVVSAYLSRIEDARAIPFNFTAAKFLSALCALGKPKSRIDIFDYGFYTADDVLALPAAEWNRLLVRNYGGQLTTDLNLPQIVSSLATQGVMAKVEKQKHYCERVLSRKLQFMHTKAGLDYSPSKTTGIEEDDGFYHLRVGK